MKGQDIFLFALTFISGVCIGFYIYVGFFKPHYLPEKLPSEVTAAQDFSVIGKTYGGGNGPEYIHPSFRLLSDGSYSYVSGGTTTQALIERTGKVPSSYIKELRAVATPTLLAQLSERVTKTDCRLYRGGTDQLYRITISGVEYVIDTCGTAASYNTELIVLLQQFWVELDNPGSLPVPPSQTPYDWLLHFLQANLAVPQDN